MSSIGRQIAEPLVTIGQVSNAADPRSLPDRQTVDRTRSCAWDPHEIWLRHIKQPRENAARVARKAAA
jgi:hypothetical protein